MNKPTKVFIVTSGCYSDYGIDKVFLDEPAAQKYCDVHNEGRGKYHDDYEIEEWPLDDWDTEEIMRTYYTCYLFIDNGEIKSQYSNNVVERPEVRHNDHIIRDNPEVGGYVDHGKSRRIVGGNSYISAEHALKIAADRRTIILAETAEGIRDENFCKIMEPMSMVGIMQEYSNKEQDGK